MIEVEKKFSLNPGAQERLISGAKFFKEVTMKDDYYDTADWSLAMKDTWLRSRNGRWELKVPLNESGSNTRIMDQYRELTTETEIAKYLGLMLSGDLTQLLQKAGYLIIAPITTIRKKYKLEPFIIDIDVMDFGYNIAEVELLVETEADMSGAIEKILTFAKSIGLTPAPVRGKVIEYIFRTQPERYQQLVAAGVI